MVSTSVVVVLDAVGKMVVSTADFVSGFACGVMEAVTAAMIGARCIAGLLVTFAALVLTCSDAVASTDANVGAIAVGRSVLKGMAFRSSNDGPLLPVIGAVANGSVRSKSDKSGSFVSSDNKGILLLGSAMRCCNNGTIVVGSLNNSVAISSGNGVSGRISELDARAYSPVTLALSVRA